jgi:hypothetical protein
MQPAGERNRGDHVNRSRRPTPLNAKRTRRAGQSVVEFALVAPLMVFIMLAVVDFARVYTTMLTVESAAREAADYGTFGSQRWNPTLYNLTPDGTEAQMERRACTAARNLPDYAGPDDNCANPVFSYELSGDRGATWIASPTLADVTALGCDDELREPPCWVKVNLHYDFHLISPIHIDFFGIGLGLPNTVPFDRQSIFPMTDLHL